METNHKLPFSLKLRHVFWIVAIFICIWFSGCSHNEPINELPVLPEGYKIICNQFGEYTWKKSNGHISSLTHNTKQEAIEYAISFDEYRPIKKPDYVWSECEGEK